MPALYHSNSSSVEHDPTQRTASSKKKKVWRSLPALSVPRQDASSTLVKLGNGGDDSSVGVVVVGGRNASAPSLPHCELLEWNVQRRWWTLPSLTTPRCGCALASINNQLFAMGGIDASSKPQASMETYKIGAHEWSCDAPNMSTPRWYASAVALEHPNNRQQIIVVGGRDEEWNELETCELYNLESRTWGETVPMSTKRFGCGVTCLPLNSNDHQQGNNKVLVVGGYTGSEWTTTCEVYNVDTDSWSFVAPMPQAVQFCVATTLGNCVFVQGQTTADNHAGVLQCFHTEVNQWKVLLNNTITAISETVGASCVSTAQRLLILGGASVVGADSTMEATTTCHSWKVDLYQLWNSTTHEYQHQPGTILVSGESSAQVLQDDDDDSSHAHPLFAMSSNQSTHSRASAPSNSITSSSQKTSSSNNARRKQVQDHHLLDNYGVQVVYSGYVSTKEGGRPGGNGKMTWDLTGDVYEGHFEHGARHGRGRMIYSNRDSFEGTFHDDVRKGRGLYSYRDGRKYDGMYDDDLAQDPNGTMTWKNGTIYVGQFTKSKRTGRGAITFPSKVRYQGDFLNGKYHGQGLCRFADGSVYQGEWKHGKAHGQGRFTNAQGIVVHNGKWVNDGPV